MSQDLEHLTLIGRLGRDPETRFTNDGTKVCNFSLAVNRKRKDQESTNWYEISVFDKKAEMCQQYLHKGQTAYVEGEPRFRDWTDRDGVKHQSLSLYAREVIWFYDGKGSDAEPKQTQTRVVSDEPPISPSPPSQADDDLPF